jgi:hypothetical protein
MNLNPVHNKPSKKHAINLVETFIKSVSRRMSQKEPVQGTGLLDPTPVISLTGPVITGKSSTSRD